MKCKVCRREAQVSSKSPYCDRHQRAYESVLDKFDAWKKASNVEWGTYLREIVKNPLTGIWAKEVAENMLSEHG